MSSPRRSTVAKAVLVVVLALLPLYLDAGYLQNGLFVMAAVVAAVGLTILVGAAGQLSLAHAFFLAVGAYSYSYFAGETAKVGAVRAHGLGLPTSLSAVLAVLVAGLLGLLFSPIASRLRGIYLGVASLSLVFIGAFVYENVRSLTGGFNGRDVPLFSVPGFEFSDKTIVVVAGVDFGRLEKLWELFLVVTVLAYVFAGNVLRGRMGRAMQTMRDSEVAAAVMGVDVRATKAGVFVLSSMYAGLGGVMLALAFGRVTPSSFDLTLSISYLAMIVIGGLGSIGGAAMGAVFVISLPYLLTRFSDSIPFVAGQGQPGYSGSELAALAYGLAVVAFVLFEPGGLSALGRRLTGRRPVRALDPDAVAPTVPAPDAPTSLVGSTATPEENA
ncbi:MAG: branched-chain amino acid ABC transporter permease [Mycobacteriales bacterium]